MCVTPCKGLDRLTRSTKIFGLRFSDGLVNFVEEKNQKIYQSQVKEPIVTTV